LPHVSTLSAAIFRALGLPDPKARFHADLQALGIDPQPST
jgi:hypothetical protein